MAEFPRVAFDYYLTGQAGRKVVAVLTDDLRQALAAYDQLSERCVMDRTELSIEIANLRARLREVDPQFPKADA